MLKLLLVTRPQFMIAVLALFAFGVFLAILLDAPFSLPRAILGYLIILPAHLSVSYSNDYYDIEVDKLGKPTKFSGGSGILVSNPELRKPAIRIAIGLIICSILFGILFTFVYSYPLWFLAFVLAANLLGWSYTAPPLRLTYRGWGELTTVITAGLLVPLMGYLIMAGRLSTDFLMFITPLTLFCLAFVLAVQIPDQEADKLGGKKTLVSQKGRGFGFVILGLSLLAATIYFFCLQWFYPHDYDIDFGLIGFLSLLPSSIGIVGMLKRPAQREPAVRLISRLLIILMLFFTMVIIYLIFLAIR